MTVEVSTINGARKRYGPYSGNDCVVGASSMRGEVHEHVLHFSYADLPQARTLDNTVLPIPDNSFILSAHLYVKVTADGADPADTGDVVVSDAISAAASDDSFNSAGGLFQTLIDLGAGPGSIINVAGDAEAMNEGAHEIITISATKIVVDSALTDDAVGDEVTISLDLPAYFNVGLANVDGSSPDPDALLAVTAETSLTAGTWVVGAGAAIGAAITDPKVVTVGVGLLDGDDYTGQTLVAGKFKLVVRYLSMPSVLA